MQVGIDKMAFATTDEYVDLRELARTRGDEPDKYTIGIGQDQQAVVPPTQDIVTLGARAAAKLLTAEDKRHLSTIIVATESGIDNSKASAIYIKHLLGLDDFVRAVELKEACYSGTAGVQFAKGLVTMNPQSTVLVIAADIARYGLATPGEVTQGAGAVAMLISTNPRVLSLEDTSVSYTKDVMDFWRPLYATEAHVDGKYSTNVYIEFFLQCWQRYQQITGHQLADFAALTFHLPFTKMGKKALEGLLQADQSAVAETLRSQLTASQIYSRKVGNLYTGSLYLGLMSLLQNGTVNAGDRIGLFSYGSGAEGEFYTGIVQPQFKKYLNDVADDLGARQRVSVGQYEQEFNAQLGLNQADIAFDLSNDHETFVLAGQKNHQRIYRRQ
ncbi:hydroxymethylglutaryl-CoA synthase [Limosilactobacillus frumenti DSM 13145]|uniref:Hydroxymethylglutaryl-CoA synthase n=1 Tax=Limosilactobacillus frumenti DSM 13145 TaxID=1423746 RepID=A0A0R1PDG4_9LACO|nr:hydroxymethylglutaryl-CoA synthase [Limosilactobacillus frumenti]KRL26979.1 hydroxymethylglutaryl-CoA synthase [Limosilactobacillus frumenti DSM 13145]MBA2914461.1 hydroxymethylglutaryl-CoA synthase [Limosilactobacillus frumenti]QFG72456.1 hydroxymethylglutaryl-CoA synthase [Limosilactobacillus frumenti]